MGKTMDALLGRAFNISKFKTLVNLAISRLSVLKNQHQVRYSHARSDVTQLLNLGHQDRALLRVEVVIKEQNMLDVFNMVENYCYLLLERLFLIENTKDCPDELDEAISSLIFTASRCGDFPELQELREVFTSRYGKEFVARAVELRNNCGVNRKIVVKLSTRQPNLESRMKVLKEIASENGIILHLEEETPVPNKDNSDEKNLQSSKLDDPNVGVEIHDFILEIESNTDQICGSQRAGKYKDVASAAQAAFVSAAYAAEAARAVVELSQSEFHDSGFDDKKSGPFRHNCCRSNEIQHTDNYSSESEGGEKLPQNHIKFQGEEEFKGSNNIAHFQRSLSASSSDSDGTTQKEETKTYSNIQNQRKLLQEITSDESDDETKNKFPETGTNDIFTSSEEKVHVPRLNLERKPISVRTRQGHGR